MVEHNLSTTDYAYCETCKVTIELWKFNYNMEESGHGACVTRDVTTEELQGCIAESEKPYPTCPECGARLDVTLDATLGSINYCGLCQKEYLPTEAKWMNAFGECVGPKDLICEGCEHLTKVSGDLTCSNVGPCPRTGQGQGGK